MECITNWIKDIAFYVILMTLLLGILPNNSYKKYVRLFSGVILVLLVISPLAKILQVDVKIANYFNIYSYVQSNNIKREEYEKMEQEGTLYVVEVYKNKIQEEIVALAESYTLSTSKVTIEVENNIESENYGKILGIQLELDGEGKEENIFIAPVILGNEGIIKNEQSTQLESEISKKISEKYDVLLENIYVQVND